MADTKKPTDSPAVASLKRRIIVTKRIERALSGMTPHEALQVLDDVQSPILKRIAPATPEDRGSMRPKDDSITAPRDTP